MTARQKEADRETDGGGQTDRQTDREKNKDTLRVRDRFNF